MTAETVPSVLSRQITRATTLQGKVPSLRFAPCSPASSNHVGSNPSAWSSVTSLPTDIPIGNRARTRLSNSEVASAHAGGRPFVSGEARREVDQTSAPASPATRPAAKIAKLVLNGGSRCELMVLARNASGVTRPANRFHAIHSASMGAKRDGTQGALPTTGSRVQQPPEYVRAKSVSRERSDLDQRVPVTEHKGNT